MRRTVSLRAIAVALTATLEIAASSHALELTSSSFASGSAIPEKFTCEGRDVSPALAWSGIPVGTQSLVLIIHDPDVPDPRAPRRIWVHWVVYGILPSATGLPEAVAASALPSGTQSGLNDWGRSGYGGPCPPIGRHRYIHTLYALDTDLAGLEHPTKAELEKAMAGHILAEAELLGTYEKERK